MPPPLIGLAAALPVAGGAVMSVTVALLGGAPSAAFSFGSRMWPQADKPTPATTAVPAAAAPRSRPRRLSAKREQAPEAHPLPAGSAIAPDAGACSPGN